MTKMPAQALACMPASQRSLVQGSYTSLSARSCRKNLNLQVFVCKAWELQATHHF